MVVSTYCFSSGEKSTTHATVTQQMQYIDMTIDSLDTYLRMHNRCDVFAEVLAEHVNTTGPQSEKGSCILRASTAQAPRKQKDASR